MKSLSIGCQISILEWFSRRKDLCELATWLCKERCRKQSVSFEKSIIRTQASTKSCYSHINGYFMKNSFERCPFEHTLYIKEGDQGKLFTVCLYVDDLIFTNNSTSMCDEFKRTLMCEFKMTDMGLLHFFLGIRVNQQEYGIFISQKK